jgi:hypothetical protein
MNIKPKRTRWRQMWKWRTGRFEPCVFPLIPLTILEKHADELKEAGRKWSEAYGKGIGI